MSYTWTAADLAGLDASVAELVALPQPLTGGNKKRATELKARMNARSWDNGPEWVVVRAARYPTSKASPPANWQQIAERCAGLGKFGHFASVSVANADDTFDPGGTAPPEPLWRGHGMLARFEGLVSGPVRPANST
jgi:hypothetical protein